VCTSPYKASDYVEQFHNINDKKGVDSKFRFSNGYQIPAHFDSIMLNCITYLDPLYCSHIFNPNKR